MLKDRGSLKWKASLMLPEHVKALREHQVSLIKKERPVLDSQQIELMEDTIRDAMEYNQSIYFSYFRNGGYQLLVGKVHYIDTSKKELRIIDEFEEVYRVEFSELVDVRRK